MSQYPDEYTPEEDDDESASIGFNHDGEAYDESTGEVYGSPDASYFYQLFSDELHKLEEIGNARIRLLCYLIRNANRRNNVCRRTQQQMADDLELSRNYTCDAIGRLEKAGLILSGRGYYQVSPQFIWMGDKEQRKRAWAVYRKKKMNKLDKPK